MTEAELREKQEQLNAILSSMAEGLIAIDNDRRVILMNQAAGILLRTAPQEATGQDIRQILRSYRDGVELPYKDLPIEKAMTERNIISVGLLENLSVRIKNGRLFPAAMMIAPLLNKGEVSGAIILFRDITKDKEIDRAKTEFVSLASHQLKTPLSAINWYSEMMLEEEVGPLNDKQKEYLKNLYDANRRMVELVNSLLNVSRIDLGTFAVEPTPTDFAAVADGVLAELAPQIALKKLYLNKEFDSQVPKINADVKLVRIVFQNLLSNAVKYTAPGGSLGLTIKREGENVLIRVTDTGYGIPAADQGKIFTKLFRADNIRDKEAEGTGLGLYIVKAVVEEVGGRIWFDSLEGRGTTFFITLPLAGMPKKEGVKGLT
ncbi:MAG: PAS domain S-box protein [Candidatus Vogelbacteria bacterium]|nr:PAS domain S-box protein [Candidatus Vogelbacteria bacterium]